MMTQPYPKTPLTEVHRLPKRAAYDRETVHAILDEALVCHIGFTTDEGQPVVLPTAFARLGETIVVHGSVISRMMKVLAGGVPLCLTVSLIDGLVLAKSAFHHSMNYRSVAVFGTATPVTDPAAKEAALRGLTEKLAPGRWDALRPVRAKEVKATTVLELPLVQVVAKTRSGPPVDDAEDLSWPIEAGVLPLRLTVGDFIPG